MNSSRQRLHRRAIPIAMLLLAVFTATTWAYSRYGYSLVLNVFEAQQLDKADESKGYMVAVRLLDYLRVDPTSDRVRGQLIDVLIDIRRFGQAVEQARVGVEAVRPEDNLAAHLHLARALAAAGELESAKSELNDVLARAKSTEAHFALAKIHAAEGDFEQMGASFTQLQSTDDIGATMEFESRRADARQTIAKSTALQSPPSDYDASTSQAASLLVLGETDLAFELLAKSLPLESDDAESLFWRGVYEEESGNDELAAEFFRAAAKRRHAWAAVALNRLQAGN